MKDFSYITNQHPGYIENLYNDFKKDPETVDADIRKFFEGFDFAINSGISNANGSNGASLTETIDAKSVISPDDAAINWKKELGAYRMVLGYRNKGHLIAKTNPIRPRKDRGANLDPAFLVLQKETWIKIFRQVTLSG